MAPPAVVGIVAGPCVILIELKKRMVRAVLRDVRPSFIVAGHLVKQFSVQPFVKGTAVIKHAVQDDLHPPAVNLSHKPCKKCVTGLQILLCRASYHILGRLAVIGGPALQRLSAVLHNHAVMRINMVIILAVILVIGWRHENRVEIDDIHTQILNIIQLIPYALQVTAVEAAHVHLTGIFAPIRHMHDILVYIKILVIHDIVGRIAIAKPVHVDLIHDGALGPVRGAKSRSDPEMKTLLIIHRRPQPVIITGLAAFYHFKAVADSFPADCNLIFVVIK